MALNANALQRAAHTLQQLMSQSELCVESRARLLRVFRFATDIGGMKKAVQVEKKWQDGKGS